MRFRALPVNGKSLSDECVCECAHPRRILHVCHLPTRLAVVRAKMREKASGNLFTLNICSFVVVTTIAFGFSERKQRIYGFFCQDDDADADDAVHSMAHLISPKQCDCGAIAWSERTKTIHHSWCFRVEQYIRFKSCEQMRPHAKCTRNLSAIISCCGFFFSFSGRKYSPLFGHSHRTSSFRVIIRSWKDFVCRRRRRCLYIW